MERSSHDLRGKTALITGAARGLGAATARRLARRGASLSLVGHEPRALACLAAELGPDAIWIDADVTDAEAIDGAVQRTVERFGGLDVVVANAGVSAWSSLEASAPEEFDRVIQVNLLGTMRTLHAALPFVVDAGGYALVVASVAACVQAPLQSAYTASKAGVEAMANSLRIELMATEARLGVAYLGFCDTDMLRARDADPVGRHVWSGARSGPFKPLHVPHVAEALARAVEQRARRVVLPRAAWPLVLAGGLLQPLLDLQVAGSVGAARRARTRLRLSGPPTSVRSARASWARDAVPGASGWSPR